MKRLNIVTTTYNDAHKYLIETIQSIKRQVFKGLNVEIIHTIVDDGTTCNESLNYLNKIDRLKNVNLISQDNKGLAAARNKGVTSSESDFILPLDADDLIHPCLLDLLIKELEKVKGKNKIAFSNWVSFGAYKRMIKVRLPTPYTIRYSNYLPVSALIPTDLCLENPYDEKMIYGCEDWELWIRLICKGCNLKHSSLYGYFHREHKSNMTDNTLSKVKDISEYIRKKHKHFYSLNYDREVKVKFKPSLYDYLRCNTSPLIRKNIIKFIK